MAKKNVSRRLLAAAVPAVAGFLLAGCVNFTALDDLKDAQPAGSPFARALFQNYAFLAHSFGDVGQAGYSTFDQIGSLSLSETDRDVAALANAYATKAMALSRGEEVDPESSLDLKSHELRDRLVRALDKGRDSFPRDAARAQADFDCWILDGAVPAAANAAMQCSRSLGVTLPRLEAELNMAAQPAEPAPAPAPAATVQSSTYTVLFDFDSWTLKGEDLTILQQAVANARAGGQSKIMVVGHTDTSGKSEYNKKLSLKRADVVKDALVDLGARREAIETQGVGEDDLAVQTGDGVREPKNRRSVITLVL